MDYAQIQERLERGQLDPVYVLVGQEVTLMNLFLRDLRRTYGGGEEVSITRFDFEESGVDDALLACQTMSLFASREIVVLSGCTALTAAKSRHDVTSLERYLENPIDARIFVITVIAEKLDERKKLTKLARKHAVVECVSPKQADAEKFLRAIAAREAVEIEGPAIAEVWRRTEDLGISLQEIRKLHTYTNGQLIRREDVTECVALPLEDNVFSWLDDVVAGRLRSSLSRLSDLQRTGKDALGLLAMMARQIRLIWFALVLGERGYNHKQIASRVGTHPYSVQVATRQSQSWRQSELETVLKELADAEYSIKTGRKDPQVALEYALLRLSVVKGRRTRVQ